MDSSPNEIPSCYFPTETPESSIVIPSYPDTSLIRDTNFTFDDISLVAPPFPPPKFPSRHVRQQQKDDMYERRQRDAYRNAGLDLSSKSKRSVQLQRSPKDYHRSQPRHDVIRAETRTSRPPFELIEKLSEPPLVSVPPNHSAVPAPHPDQRRKHIVDKTQPANALSKPKDGPDGQDTSSGFNASAAALFEKLRYYKDRLLSSSESRKSLSDPPSAPPTLDDEVPIASAPATNSARLVVVASSSSVVAAVSVQAPAHAVSERPHEVSSSSRKSARETVYNTHQAAATSAPLPVVDLPPTSIAPSSKEHPLISALTEEIRHKRTASEDLERPAKKAKHTVLARSNKENAPLAGGPTQERAPATTSHAPKKRATLAPLPALTVPVSHPFASDRERQRTVSKESDEEHGKPKAKAEAVKVARALPNHGQRQRTISKEPDRERDKGESKAERAPLSRPLAVSDLKVNSRVPSTSFNPALPAVPQLSVPKHKDAFQSMRATWETRSTSNYHPTPDFAAIHARDALRMSKRHVSATTVVPQRFEFATEARAKEREDFEHKIREKEAQLAQLKEQRRREEEERAAEEVLALRKKLDENVKANEVPIFIKKRAEKARSVSVKVGLDRH